MSRLSYGKTHYDEVEKISFKEVSEILVDNYGKLISSMPIEIKASVLGRNNILVAKICDGIDDIDFVTKVISWYTLTGKVKDSHLVELAKYWAEDTFNRKDYLSILYREHEGKEKEIFNYLYNNIKEESIKVVLWTDGYVSYKIFSIDMIDSIKQKENLKRIYNAVRKGRNAILVKLNDQEMMIDQILLYDSFNDIGDEQLELLEMIDPSRQSVFVELVRFANDKRLRYAAANRLDKNSILTLIKLWNLDKAMQKYLISIVNDINTLLEILKTSNLHGWKKREIKKQILRIS